MNKIIGNFVLLIFWCFSFDVVLVSVQIGQFLGWLIEQFSSVLVFYFVIFRLSFIYSKEFLLQKSFWQNFFCVLLVRVVLYIIGKSNGIVKIKLLDQLLFFFWFGEGVWFFQRNTDRIRVFGEEGVVLGWVVSQLYLGIFFFKDEIVFYL